MRFDKIKNATGTAVAAAAAAAVAAAAAAAAAAVAAAAGDAAVGAVVSAVERYCFCIIIIDGKSPTQRFSRVHYSLGNRHILKSQIQKHHLLPRKSDFLQVQFIVVTLV